MRKKRRHGWMWVLLSFSMDEPTSVGLPRTSQDQSAHAGPSPVIPVRASPPRPPRLSCVLSFCPRHIWSVQLSWMNCSFFYEWNSFLIADERVRSTGRDWQSPPTSPGPLPCSWTTGQSQTSRVTHAEVEKKSQHSGRCIPLVHIRWNIECIIYNYTVWIKNIICKHTNVWNAKAVPLI